MPPRVQILCINKSDRDDPYDAIDYFGGKNADGNSWSQSLSQMIELIENEEFEFYVDVNGISVDVIIAKSYAGNKYLKTVSDGNLPNNLLSLPEC